MGSPRGGKQYPRGAPLASLSASLFANNGPGRGNPCCIHNPSVCGICPETWFLLPPTHSRSWASLFLICKMGLRETPSQDFCGIKGGVHGPGSPEPTSNEAPSCQDKLKVLKGMKATLFTKGGNKLFKKNKSQQSKFKDRIGFIG